MIRFSWDSSKNDWLMKARGVSFERVVFLIENGGLLDIVEHTNPIRYPNQRTFILEIDNYAWLVPFVESEGVIWLKTAIPSRKATKLYLGGLYEH